ncbi:MAG TPA: hypothetical protein VMJ10_04335 [Kofleriaceae bacterium]|nr:hypothetical protein [Kofleriaceae bacterium]
MTRVLALAAIALAAVPAAARPGEVVVIDHRDPSALPSRGPANAPVTIEVFLSPVRRGSAIKLVEQLQARHPSQIRIVYRVVSGNGSARMPYVALEANVEGKFQELLDALEHERSLVTDQRLLEIGRQLGLDTGRVDEVFHRPPAVFQRAIADNDRRRHQRVPSQALPAALFNGEPEPQLGTMTMFDLERVYQDASKRAADLVDRGADPAHLADAFDAEPPSKPLDVVVQTGPPDDELEGAPSSPPLATPPLRLRGLPSYGSPDAPVAIVVACNPTSTNCRQPLGAATLAVDALPQLVRVVWAPNFDLAGENAADLALLGDAALCAERVGAANDIDFDRPASPGWRWLVALGEDNHRRETGVGDRLVHDLADRLRVPRRAFEACRARTAGTTVAWIEAARRSGVRTTPATIVGGRIYGAINSTDTLQNLVAAELAPGSCDVDHGCLHLGDYTPSWRRGL